MTRGDNRVIAVADAQDKGVSAPGKGRRGRRHSDLGAIALWWIRRSIVLRLLIISQVAEPFFSLPLWAIHIGSGARGLPTVGCDTVGKSWYPGLPRTSEVEPQRDRS